MAFGGGAFTFAFADDMQFSTQDGFLHPAVQREVGGDANGPHGNFPLVRGWVGAVKTSGIIAFRPREFGYNLGLIYLLKPQD